jgi:threonine dehydrogenase-like Zn-dependent dehydrogenase
MVLRPGSIVHQIPDHVSTEDAVLFNPVGAGFEWAYRAAGTQPGDTVLILGPGQRGLGSVVAAREAGAEQIIVTGLPRDTAKLELAVALGATEVIQASGTEVVERVMELTAGEGADRVVDVTSSAPTVVPDAIAAARAGGRIVLAGLRDGVEIPGFVSDAIVFKDLTVRGVLGVTSWSFRQAIRVIASERYPLARLHTHTLPLERLVEGISILDGAVEGEQAIHVTVVPGAPNEAR